MLTQAIYGPAHVDAHADVPRPTGAARMARNGSVKRRRHVAAPYLEVQLHRS